MRTSDFKASLDTPLKNADETTAGIARFGTREEILEGSDLPLIVAPQEELLLQGFRNAIINGSFDFWQRDSSFIGLTDGYTADRWYIQANGGSSVDVTQGNPVGAGDRYLRMTVNTADPTLASDAYLVFLQIIEGYNARVFRYQPLSYSFWVRSSMPGVFTGAIRFGDSSYSIVHSFTIEQANTWEKKTALAIPSLISAQPGYTEYRTGRGLTLLLTFACGTDFHASTPGQWEVGNKVSVAGSSNFLSSVGITIDIAEVQLEPGYTITPFEYRPIGLERTLCKRYFEKTYDEDVPVGTATNQSTIFLTKLHPSMSTVLRFNSEGHRFSVEKRAIPTMTFYSTNGVVGYMSRYNSPSEIREILSVSGTTKRHPIFYMSINDPTVDLEMAHVVHYTADSEL